jgi:spore maturation protein CgeB
LKIALIADSLTYDSLSIENNVIVKNITPVNYKVVLKFFKPDILFVESAWQGYKNKWKFKIASYPEHPKRSNKKLKNVVQYAKELGIPTVFWNKEDGIHFDRFIDSAKLFEHIFTVDENCIQRYKEIVDENVTVNTLMFAVQHKFHNFTGFHFKYKQANFVGSYSHHVHEKRKIWQDMMFKTVLKIGMELTVYDRNSDRKSSNYRYPNLGNLHVISAVPYEKTASIYKDYIISLNVNTIEDSPTMFSRRLIEILACGGIAVTNSTVAIHKLFREYCHIVSTEEEMHELFYRIHKFGLSEKDKERARAGAEYVVKYHTWTHRLEEIRKVLNFI